MDDAQLDAKNADEALNVIYDEAEKLLQVDDLPKRVEEGLERILALARYKMNVLPDE